MKNNKIEVRGIIVSSDWDVSFMFPYIKKGIITPESYVRKQIEELDTKKDIDLYINSPGGSVFSGNEMINTLQDWKIKNGKKINVTIGAMAASMGSAIMVSVGDTTKVHTNSKIMFHSAKGGNEGGPEAMRDTAELLEQINSDIKVKLLSKYDLAPETIEEWFKEGREGWISSDEAMKIGMASEIIGGTDTLPESADNIESMLNERGMQIAALTLKKFKTGETKMEKLTMLIKSIFSAGQKVSEEDVELAFAELEADEEVIEEVVEEAEEVEDGTDKETAEDELDSVESTDNTADEGEADGESEGDAESDGDATEDAEVEEELAEEETAEEEVEVEEVVEDSDNIVDMLDTQAEMQEACIELSEKVESLNLALNKKQSENDKMKANVEKLTSKLERLLGNGTTFKEEESAPADWDTCLEKCDRDYVVARKTYPKVFAKFMGLKK